MTRIAIDVNQETYEVLRKQKDKLGLTWEEALIRGLAVGPTPVEQLGFPDPFADLTHAASREEEFLEKLEEAKK